MKDTMGCPAGSPRDLPPSAPACLPTLCPCVSNAVLRGVEAATSSTRNSPDPSLACLARAGQCGDSVTQRYAHE